MHNQNVDYNAGDVAFVRKMIPHHQMAVDMAKKELAGAANAQVRNWASAIAAGQAEEIVKFKAWLDERGLI